MFDVDTREAADRLGGRAGVSRIERLYLVGYSGSRCTFPDVQALIAKIDALRDSAFNIHDDSMTTNLVILNTKLWECLQTHSDTLERIDFYRSAPSLIHREGTGHFGVLRGLQRLRHLSIQVEVALGGCCDEPLAPFRLRDTLPSTLESLTFYAVEGFRAISDLPKQLIELLDRGEYPALVSIVLEQDDYICDDSMVLQPSYAEL